jgi:hypothetical protein
MTCDIYKNNKLLIYPIKRWDAVVNPTNDTNNIYSNPCFYIDIDKNIILALNDPKITDENNCSPIKILDTNSPYDNQIVMARFDLSENVAGYRPNYQEKYKQIVGRLATVSWDGYPRNLGFVAILNPTYDPNLHCQEIINTQLNEQIPNEHIPYENIFIRKCNLFQKKHVYRNVIIIFIFILLFIIIYKISLEENN